MANGLTNKQRAALKRCSGASRAALLRSFQQTTVGNKQGAGAITRRPMGSSPGRTLSCWDAFHPSHLALPRPVAPYTVIRTTQIWSQVDVDKRRFNFFGPTTYQQSSAHYENKWCSQYALGANSPLSGLVSAAVRTESFGSMNVASAGWTGASIVPAAFSIQILNPEALQTTSGMVYVGRLKNRLNFQDIDQSHSWQDLADSCVSYCNPRLCAAGKLALRGVQVDAIPNNMNELADFTDLATITAASTTGSAVQTRFSGFNPIFVYNPDGINLQILVTCEWRVRFTPYNPAHAACVPHQISTDGTWANLMTKAESLGNGVVDIADKVAALGAFAERAIGPAQRLLALA